ncbi:hypothetical protein [Halobacillus litoralis]
MAHRGYREGKLFKSLDEVQKGSNIVLMSPSDSYEYEVRKNSLLLPMI